MGNWQNANETVEKAGGDIVPLNILYRLLYLAQKARIKLDPGPPYAVMTNKEWAKTLLVKIGRVKKALKFLRDAELIQTRKAMFGGKSVNHLRLHPDIVDHTVGLNPTIGLNPTDPLVQNGPTGRSNMDQPIYLKNKMKNQKKTDNNFVAMKPPHKSKSETKLKAGELIDRVPSFQNARKLWATYWHKNFDGPVDGFPQSPKAKRMFSDWCTKVPESTFPLQLIARALDNWSEFREIVQERTGKKLPQYPELYSVLWNLPSLLEVSQPEKIETQAIPMKGDSSHLGRLKKLIGES